ncbi:response regulator [Myxosarcina sp. GI1]|uniref:response regulator n=1 Tax=Myxosarcina sp. GI1 TaxID=1541065 RepID=UPI00056978ED|nr:response regulator [Myxosarcina sp. GI1]
MKLPRKKLHILLVEDSASDTMLIRRSLQKSNLDYSLYCVEDGEKAIAFLRRQGDYKQAVRPDLIILDLNLPRLDGREVLAEIKNDSVLKRIPVIVMTTSSSEQDIVHSYDLHANCYIVKPFDVHDFMQIADLVEQFWLRTVALPG